MFSALLAMLVGLIDDSESRPGPLLLPFLWMAGKVPRLPVDRLQIALEAGTTGTAILIPIGTGTATASSLTSIVVVSFPPN
jgi:hypothetical protein